MTVAGVRGTWQLDPEQLERVDEPLAGRAAVLSPLDAMVMDRRRIEELFGWEYTLEMYVPEARRRWGYFALPVLVGDTFVGKLDAEARADDGVLHVRRLHRDSALSRENVDAVENEIRSLATMLGLTPSFGPGWSQKG